MKLVDNYYVWNKGEKGPLSKYFFMQEFACPCSRPHTDKIAMSLINKLDEIRQEVGSPIRITSGYRCSDYQQDLRDRNYETSTGPSSHENGEAFDGQPIKPDKFDSFKKACEARFEAIGVAKTWLHCDLRTGAIRRWYYK